MGVSDEPVSDYVHAPQARPTATPPAAKVAREYGTTVREVAVIAAATAALLAGKLDPNLFLAVLIGMMTGHFARSKAEGAVGEQTLIELTKGRSS